MLFSFFCKKKRINIKYYSNQPFSMSDFPAIFLPRDSQGQSGTVRDSILSSVITLTLTGSYVHKLQTKNSNLMLSKPCFTFAKHFIFS